MTWVTLFPLKSMLIDACTPRHFCFGATPLFPLELRGPAKSKMPSSRGKNGGHAPLESVTHVIRLSQARALPRTSAASTGFSCYGTRATCGPALFVTTAALTVSIFASCSFILSFTVASAASSFYTFSCSSRNASCSLRNSFSNIAFTIS